jgi:hypothetical protein
MVLTCGFFVLSDRFGHFQVGRRDGLNRCNKTRLNMFVPITSASDLQ